MLVRRSPTIGAAASRPRYCLATLLDTNCLGKVMKMGRLAMSALLGPDFTPDGRHGAKARYMAHYTKVRMLVPAERLLEYEVSWAPLCAFLEKRVPEVELTRTNDTKMSHYPLYDLPAVTFDDLACLPLAWNSRCWEWMSPDDADRLAIMLPLSIRFRCRIDSEINRIISLTIKTLRTSSRWLPPSYANSCTPRAHRLCGAVCLSCAGT
ncbi:hypothetical protein C8R43DRAFT_1235260 [Mycena crocata]|nr:hypothetical protein C8R43DRAFT_1235260 [Mycena crocata]